MIILSVAVFEQISDFISPICNYTEVCPDKTVNAYGLKLVQMCIETGLRILNGRHADYMANDSTYCGANGCCVIDYVLSNPGILLFFMVCNFNTYFLIMHHWTSN